MLYWVFGSCQSAWTRDLCHRWASLLTLPSLLMASLAWVLALPLFRLLVKESTLQNWGSTVAKTVVPMKLFLNERLLKTKVHVCGRTTGWLGGIFAIL